MVGGGGRGPFATGREACSICPKGFFLKSVPRRDISSALSKWWIERREWVFVSGGGGGGGGGGRLLDRKSVELAGERRWDQRERERRERIP